jgi:hypothetical protein
LALIVVAAVVACLVLALAVALVRFNLKRVHIRRHAAAATDAQLEAIYRLVEANGTEPAVACVLARTNRAASDAAGVVALPDDLAEFPWNGRAVAVGPSPEAAPFAFMATAASTTQLAGRVFRPVRVPRRRGKSGKVRSVLAPSRLASGNEPLLAALRAVCPEHPVDLLSHLLMAGADTFEFEPIDQARIGGSPAWVQDPEWPKCESCGATMALILQLPGSLLSPNRSETLYWLGCRQHPDTTKAVTQRT